MEGNYLEYANSARMWMAVIPAICITVFQAYVFSMRSIKVGHELGITNDEFKRAAITAGLASIGPAVVIAAGTITLILAIGGPMAWMRLAFIGSIMFELSAAEQAVAPFGVTLGGEGMTVDMFTNCVWAMTLLCMGWIIVSALFSHKIESLTAIVSKGDPRKVQVIAAASSIGVFMYIGTNQITGSFNPGAATVAFIVSFLVQAFFIKYGKANPDKKWVGIWSFTISMFTGLIVAVLYATQVAGVSMS